MAAEAQAWLNEFSYAPEERNALIALVETGNVEQVETALKAIARDHQGATVWQIDFLPEIRAAISWNKHEPQQAIDALEPARQIEKVTFGPKLLRGRAYLAAGKTSLAIGEFQKISSHIYADTMSTLFPLGELELDRAYALTGEAPMAREHYERFFKIWENADPDIPLLATAKLAYQVL